MTSLYQRMIEDNAKKKTAMDRGQRSETQKQTQEEMAKGRT